MRSEVLEDLLHFDQVEYEKRRDARIGTLAKTKRSFILDASADRQWGRVKEYASQHTYHVYIISLDLSKDFLLQLYHAKGYNESAKRIDQLIAEHDQFLQNYSADVGLHITNELFLKRLPLALEAAALWIRGIGKD